MIRGAVAPEGPMTYDSMLDNCRVLRSEMPDSPSVRPGGIKTNVGFEKLVWGHRGLILDWRALI